MPTKNPIQRLSPMEHCYIALKTCHNINSPGTPSNTLSAVAKMLADAIESVERHYALLTKELQDRVLDLIDKARKFGETDRAKIAQPELRDRIIH